jgi:hypothetical protein
MRINDIVGTSSILTEAPLADYVPMGDFNKAGPFTSQVDKKLVTNPTNQLKTAKFLENTPYDFRLFFSNISGTATRYKEAGAVSTDVVRAVFKDQADQIITNHENAINVVFLGNYGVDKVMMTPWIMAHRLGHAIQASNLMSRGSSAWKEVEPLFFSKINSILAEYYGKSQAANLRGMNDALSAEYSALFNAIGTQRSSRTGQITRPYEFLYEMFAQYLQSEVKLNPFPKSLGYGKHAWGKHTNFLSARGDFSDDQERESAADRLSNDMNIMFSDVLSDCVGKIFLM